MLPQFALAAVAEFEPKDSFELGIIQSSESNQVVIGELANFPHTWEFVVTEKSFFKAQLSVRPDGNQRSSLILIKEEKRGVSEVGRRAGKNESWQEYQDDVSELRFTRSNELVAELSPGVYRIEVSSPKNEGQYRLDINQTADISYFQSLDQIFALHGYFGSGYLGTIVTWQVYLPIILLVLSAVWLYRRHKYA